MEINNLIIQYGKFYVSGDISILTLPLSYTNSNWIFVGQGRNTYNVLTCDYPWFGSGKNNNQIGLDYYNQGGANIYYITIGY